MKALLLAAGAVALTLGLIAAGVFGADDGSTFVPPPEAAAENFVRALSRERYEIARGLMSDEARRREHEAGLRARVEPVLQELGKINNVDAKPSSRTASNAYATATIEGETGTATLLLHLVRAQGLWKVDRWELKF